MPGRHLFDNAYKLAKNGLYVPIEGIDGLDAAPVGHVVTKQADGRLALQAPSGGGGGGGTVPNWVNYHPFNPPTSPNADDDEFDSSTLNAAWTLATTNANTDIDTTWRSAFFARLTNGNNGSAQISKSMTAAGDFDLICRMFGNFNQLNYQGLLFVADAGGTNAVYLKWLNNNVTLMTEDAGAFTDRFSIGLAYFTTLMLHLQRVGTNWSVYLLDRWLQLVWDIELEQGDDRRHRRLERGVLGRGHDPRQRRTRRLGLFPARLVADLGKQPERAVQDGGPRLAAEATEPSRGEPHEGYEGGELDEVSHRAHGEALLAALALLRGRPALEQLAGFDAERGR